jgi:hypothetical protein
MKKVYVTKFDGRKQLYNRNKVMRTCMRMNVGRKAAEAVVDKIESKLYDGMTTKEILKLVFKYTKEYKPEIAYEINLRQSIALLRPKPDFEQFIARMLEAEGYEVETNNIVKGNCTEHEVDAIARKGRDIVCVEVKHHYQHHRYTGLDVFLESWASFEDMQAGYKANKNSVGFNRLLVVCNTKISDHAKQYASCKDFNYLAWKAPAESLENLVDKHKLYPITLLKGMNSKTATKLSNANIILLKQLVREDADRLARRLKIQKKEIRGLINKGDKLLHSKR